MVYLLWYTHNGDAHGTHAILTVAILTVALLTVALLTVAILTVALLTVAILTVAILTVVILTVVILTRFEPQLRAITKHMRTDRQTLMFSATWPAEVCNLCGRKLVTD